VLRTTPHRCRLRSTESYKVHRHIRQEELPYVTTIRNSVSAVRACNQHPDRCDGEELKGYPRILHRKRDRYGQSQTDTTWATRQYSGRTKHSFSSTNVRKSRPNHASPSSTSIEYIGMPRQAHSSIGKGRSRFRCPYTCLSTTLP